MCGGLGNAPKALMPAAAMMRAEKKENKRERKQERLTDRHDELAERRIAKEEALAAEMKAMRQDARQERQDYRAQERAVAPTQGDSYQVQSTTAPVAAQSAQAVVGQNSGLQAPGAALSGRRGRRGRQGNASSSLRIGPASTGSGAGPNVAV
jgi:hypothetical protein